MSRPFTELLEAHQQKGGEIVTAPGPIEHRCNPSLPSRASVLTVDADGTVTTRYTCDPVQCTARSLSEKSVVELVIVDLTPWIEPKLDHGDAMRALDNLLSILEKPTRATPLPRILVTHVPIEAAGEHGRTGYRGDAMMHTLYPPLRDSVLAGAFDGVFASRDHALYAQADLGDAIRRSDLRWPTRPLWQVVAGSSSQSTARSIRVAPRTRYFTSSAYVPEVWSPHHGFAVVHVDASRVRIELHTERPGRGARGNWQVARLETTSRGEPYPPRTSLPSTAPCLRCPVIPASERP